MAFTGKFGTIGSMPGAMILGGNGPGDGGDIDVDALSAIALNQLARSSTFDASASSSPSFTQSATTSIPWHRSASNPISVAQTAASSIKMVVATSSLAITQSAAINIKYPVATSAITLTQQAKNTTIDKVASSLVSLASTAACQARNVSASSSLSISVVCTGESTRNPTSSTLTLTQSASSPKPFRRSASSSISLTSSATGIGPIKRTVVSTLTLTDMARSNIIQLPVFDFLPLNHAARVANTYVLSATNALVLSQVTVGVNNHVYANSPITLFDVADNSEKRRSVSNAITVVDTASVEKVKTVKSELVLSHEASQGIVALQINQPLTLTDLARLVSVKLTASPSIIGLTDTVTSNIKMLTAKSTLVIDQSLNVIRPWRLSAVNALTTVELVFDLNTFSFIEVLTGLQDSVSVVRDGPRQAYSIISFATPATQYVVRSDAIPADATSALALSQEARLSKQVKNENLTIPLSQSATGVVGIELKNQLDTLNVAATVTVVRVNITASNTLEVKHAVAFIFEKSNVLCTYTPFVGESSDPNAPIPPPPTYTAPGATPGFRLQYPGTGPVTDELILRAPNLGNIDRLSMTRINRETRGGTLIVYADPIWPKVETLLLSFSGLSFDESQDLLEFMENHLGEEIRLIDWEDRVWKGVIVNPQDPVVQDGRGCKYTASFEFEGEKV